MAPKNCQTVLNNMANNIVPFKKKFDKFQNYYLYGVSNHTQEVAEFIKQKGKKIIACVDKDQNKWGHHICGVPVIPPYELINHITSDAAIIIVSAYLQEIYYYLTSNGVPGEQIFPLLDSMFFPTYDRGYISNPKLDMISLNLKKEERQYFESWRTFKETGDIGVLLPIKIESNIQYDYRPWSFDMRIGECCLDVGAFDGKTALEFLKTGFFSQIVCFEPFNANYKQLCHTFESTGTAKNIKPIKMALGSKNREYFVKAQGFSSRARALDDNQPSGEIIDERTLDSFGIKNVSMIKVDIEGDELNFLMGARNTILTNKPHLVISAYHQKDHCYRIFDFIKALQLPFRLNVAHHPLAIYELEYYFSFCA